MNHLEHFNQHRPLLLAIAYRMLGTIADAEDIVQETFLRWQQVSEAKVQSPKSYLCAIVTRLCIDRLQSARIRREQYVGKWLPEQIITQSSSDPFDIVELADSLSTGFLVLLENLSPIERAIFLLREISDYDYAQIGQIVSKSLVNCRQILRRARQHLSRRPNFDVSPQEREQITVKFLEAWTQGNLQDLLSLLSEDVTFWSDGSGKVTATLKPLHSPRKIARFLLVILCSKKRSTLAFKLAEINGQPGILNYVDGHLQSVWTFDIFDGRLYTIYSVLNPNKLVRLKAEG